MGYDLHIIRGEDWAEAEPVPADAWITLVEGLSDFNITGAVEATNAAGELVRYESPALAHWTAHPSGLEVPFDCRDGQVVVKNPDGPTIRRMVEVAVELDARVQGDDGEWYDGPPAPTGRSKGVRRWRR